MKGNVGSIDRWARVALGLAIVAAGFYFKSWFGLIGFLPLGTALVGWCPAYVPFGLSTRVKRSEGSSA